MFFLGNNNFDYIETKIPFFMSWTIHALEIKINKLFVLHMRIISNYSLGWNLFFSFRPRKYLNTVNKHIFEQETFHTENVFHTDTEKRFYCSLIVDIL